MTPDLSEINARLDRIESLLKRTLALSSPASLPDIDKGRILAEARKQGRAALKSAAKKLNGVEP